MLIFDVPGMIEGVEEAFMVKWPICRVQSLFGWTRCMDLPDERKRSVQVRVPRYQTGGKKRRRRESGPRAE